MKLNFLNRPIKFETMKEFQTFENILQVIKNEELEKYNQLLHRIRSIDTEFRVKEYFILFNFFDFC